MEKVRDFVKEVKKKKTVISDKEYVSKELSEKILYSVITA